MAKIKIELPNDLYNEISVILEERGITISDYVAVALRGMPKSPLKLDTGDSLPFGKYSGSRVGDVARADPAYIRWMIDSVTRIQFTECVIKLVAELIE